MKIRIIAVTFGVLAFTILAPGVWAQPGWAAGIGAVPLELTPEQQSQIREMITSWQLEFTPLWTDLQAKGMALRSLLWNGNADSSELEAKSKEYSDLQAQYQRKSLELSNSIRGILTDEQKIIYDQIGLGYGLGQGAGQVGIGPSWGGGFGRGRGFGRGFGRGRGGGWGQGAGFGPGFVPGSTGYGPGWGRGPCGMGLGRAGFSPWLGRRPW